MVAFKLLYKTDTEIRYEYYPEDDKNSVAGLIGINVVEDTIELLQPAERDRKKHNKHIQQKQNRVVRKHHRQLCCRWCFLLQKGRIFFRFYLTKAEFCGLTINDIDLENGIVNIDHQLLRDSNSHMYIQSTKTNAGTRKLSIKEDVIECFKRIIADRPKVKFEKMIDGYAGFLCLDKKGDPLVAMHWEGRFSHMVGRYNSIFKVQMPKITPHVCRHTYCSIQAKSGMNPKTLQYLMGHSEIGVTLNTYTHLGLEDAAEELKRMEDLEKARKEIFGEEKEKMIKQNMFKVV